MLVDPDGMQIVYHEDNSLLFNIGTRMRIAWHSIFGTKETRQMISDLKDSPNEHVINQRNGSGLFGGNLVLPKAYVDWKESQPRIPIDDSKGAWEEYDNKTKEWQKNEPENYKDGTGDGSYVYISYQEKIETDGDFKQTKTTTLFHELYHSWRMDRGEASEGRQIEEIKSVQFVNRNFRNENNRRERYGEWLVPKEN